jgi:hypothetical protein
MKVTVTPCCAMRGITHEQFLFQPRNQKRELEPVSMDNPFRKSSRACLPAS